MPVTVRLSKNFYDRFGDELVDELVEWFNLVDATYKSDLRDMNEASLAKFDAKIDHLASDLRGEMHAGFTRLDKTIADARADLIKWSFVFWVGAVAAIAMLARVLDR